jgi:hypothetical protein
MRRLFNRRNILAIIAAIVVLPALWWVSAPIRGQLMAHYDIERGHFQVLDYGLLSPGFREYRQLLRERYGVDARPLGCVITDASYVNAYNRVVMDTVNRKFGRDVFTESWAEAMKLQLQKQKAAPHNVSPGA